MNSNALLDQLRNDALRDQAKTERAKAKPLSSADPALLAAGLRERINPLYADQIGTESYERRMCVEAIEGLLRERDGLLAALEGFMENTEEPPARNCSCHISPPCNDCVDYSSLREVFEIARAAIANVKGKT